MSLKYTKTRIAPTPSGFLHLGNIYSFLLTASLARQSDARILLRIDDLDGERVRPEYIQDIFDALNFMQIRWDEGPATPDEFERRYSQQHRMPLYQEALDRLVADNAVYACTCSRSELLRKNTGGGYPGTCRNKGIPLDERGVCWRLKTDPDKKLIVKNLERPFTEEVLPAKMADFIVRKKDGYPAYQLSSVVDDTHFGVDLIVRGEDLLDSTLAQVYLSGILENGFASATFHHHALLMENGGKLSKSAGAMSLKFFRENGYLPNDVSAMIGKLENQES